MAAGAPAASNLPCSSVPRGIEYPPAAIPPRSPTPRRGAKAHARMCPRSPGRAARWQSGSACQKLNEERRWSRIRGVMGSVVNICKQTQAAVCFQPCAFTSSGRLGGKPLRSLRCFCATSCCPWDDVFDKACAFNGFSWEAELGAGRVHGMLTWIPTLDTLCASCCLQLAATGVRGQ